MPDARFLLFAGIVLIANTAETVTGFGATVIAVTLAAHLYGIDYLVPVLIPTNLVVSAYLVARYHQAIDRERLLKRILPLAVLGMPFGFALFYTAEVHWLKWAFGAFVLVMAAHQLGRIVRAGPGAPQAEPMSFGQAAAWLVSGGIIHGLYGTGGPMIVLYAGRELPDKLRFRSTMSTLWLILNVGLVIVHAAGGTINSGTLAASALLAPSLILGLVIGEWLHRRIDGHWFRIIVYGLLVVAGASLLIPR